MASWKETLGISGKGIPGVTRPLDSPGTGNEMVVYGQEGSKDRSGNPGCLGIVRAPVDLFIMGVKATVGGGMLAVGRGIMIADPTIELKHESKKRKKRREKLVSELDGTGNWTRAIKNTVDSVEQLRRSPGRVSSLAARTLGPENMAVIDGSLAVNQRTPVEVKPIQSEEISFAQRILAAASGKGRGLEDEVIRKINEEALKNLQNVGEMAADQMEAQRLIELRERSKFVVSRVGWWEGLLAAVGGATGSTGEAINGGYEVSVNQGVLNLRIGRGDVNAIAPTPHVTVDQKIPGIYSATLAVVDKESPRFGENLFTRIIRKMAGTSDGVNMPLKPGGVILGMTGSPEKTMFPALHVDVHARRIADVSQAGEKLTRRLEELKKVEGNSPEQMVRILIDKALEGAQRIPRRPVVLEILGKISPTDEEITKPVVTEPRPENTTLNNQALIERPTKRIEKPRKPSQLELDLAKAGINDLDVRSAKLLIKFRANYEKKWKEKFGEKEAKRLMRNISRRARTILELKN